MIRSGVHSACVLLLVDRSQNERRTQQHIVQAAQVCEITVGTTCRRFVLEGLEATLSEKPRPGKAPKITGNVEAQLVLLACSEPPEGFARWTMQMLADKLVELGLVESISDSTICDRLKNAQAVEVVRESCAVLRRKAVGSVRCQV